MREILFRGKRLDNGKWVYGDLSFHVQMGIPYVFPADGYDSPDCYEVDPSTVGQYTGLKDKNGKQIFEGDILAFLNKYRGANSTWNCVVEFLEGSFVCTYIQEGYTYNHFTSWNAPVVEWEIIGNIHDNPELLQVKS